MIWLLYASTCFEHYVLTIRRSKLYYTASGIITPVGGRPVHRLRADCAPHDHLQVWWYQMLYNTIWPPDDEHIVPETCGGIRWTYYKGRICALSWLITRIILRCTVSKTSKYCKKLWEINMESCKNFLYGLWVHNNLFLDNAELYTTKTRNSNNLHPPLSQLTKYQKRVHFARIRVFNHLPTSIKNTANETKVFKKTLTLWRLTTYL